ncbi:alanine--tRNA ligase [Corynebacterium sp. sy017]|uniref:alanine--tRNA ligase n=1 Tax=unclassified Corynebacterium TaxID=2624378 RepID=UPI0011848874|nr:alanine--tRNA ligase [Corynebacterium sp. SY003]MBP3087703.1 alanine--tRNA ligase [Corynebacterium sp. sy017]TSD92259.1 alanine--tRNA ligase [Corynebacterium sp. SY003]
MQTHEIRERFINHFVKKGHTFVPSASLILDDPNLLFVNAGMVPFKPYFLGQQTPPFANGTATSIQKCVRTLDIDEVGITTRHNTFFQMAGNFSFGQYFKQGAIENAWSLLTSSVADGGYGLDPERLWVTVYLDDDEAADIWHNHIGVPTERIQRLGMADNYWSMGVPGPCGPCSEIYYDRGSAYGKEGGPIADDNRYMEIWNLVFMENERGEGIGKDDFHILGPLPKKNIDTGLGVERVACILQNVENVYETDLLRPVIDIAEQLTSSVYGKNNTDDIRFRVIADHSRTAMMLILDGVTPGNEGRGYILRRLLRRIIRSARLLGAQGQTMEKFINTIMDTMTPSYPEIADNRERIIRVAVTEENAFLKTLESGTSLFEQAAADIKQSGKRTIAGSDAFALHDTYGFPIDLTLEMASEAGLSVDLDGFNDLMAQQKARAKADNRAKKHGHTDLSVYRQWVDENPTQFSGYDELESEAKIIGLLIDGKKVDEVPEGTTSSVEVILDRSPLYAESGGQLGDRGQITMSGSVVEIDDVQKIAKKLWVHKAHVVSGGMSVGDVVRASVDTQWRHAARQAHSATHLIHGALRQVLGSTAVQAGSMNKPGYLRFDFNYTDALTSQQLEQIELLTNEAIDRDWQVNTVETSLEEAKAMGAMALFGENYGDVVRVVEIGGPFSMELCGGTHVAHASQIGPVSVLNESSVGSGVRRIEAYTGLDAMRYLAKERVLAENLATMLKTPSSDLPERIEQLVHKLKEAEKTIEDMRRAQLLADSAKLKSQAILVNGVEVVCSQLPDGVSAQDLRSIASDLKNSFGSKEAVVVLSSVDSEKVPFVIAVSQAAVSRGLKAGDLVKLLASYVAGRGGGKPDMAQGAGSDAAGIDAGFTAIKDAIENN